MTPVGVPGWGEPPDVVARRLHTAREELAHFGDYHYLVVNDDLEVAYRDVRAIYRARSLRCQRQSHHARSLLEEAQKNGE